jgi:uncharacterized protein (UPF0333 family)
MAQSKDIWRKIVVLAVVGGLAFWAISIATSLVPITVDYRAARWSAQTVWVGSLPAGMIIGFLLSFVLVRFFDKIPTKNPILKSVILSIIALVIGAIILEAPSSFGTSDALYYFLFGTMLNVPRFLFVGIVIGYLYKRMYKESNPAVIASKSAQVE